MQSKIFKPLNRCNNKYSPPVNEIHECGNINTIKNLNNCLNVQRTYLNHGQLVMTVIGPYHRY